MSPRLQLRTRDVFIGLLVKLESLESLYKVTTAPFERLQPPMTVWYA